MMESQVCRELRRMERQDTQRENVLAFLQERFGAEASRAVSEVVNTVEDIELLNPFNLQESLDDKLSILDIKARDQSGRQFNVEMQMLAHPTFEKRILYYWARLHQQQLPPRHAAVFHRGDRVADDAPDLHPSLI